MAAGGPGGAPVAAPLSDCEPYPLALGTAVLGSRRLIDTVIIKSRLSLNIALESTAVQPQKAFARRGDGICFQYQIGTLRDLHGGRSGGNPLNRSGA